MRWCAARSSGVPRPVTLVIACLRIALRVAVCHCCQSSGSSAAVTTASLRADLENERARNRRLKAELTTLRRRLGEVIGRDVLGQISAPKT
jgi:hypothetical protein